MAPTGPKKYLRQYRGVGRIKDAGRQHLFAKLLGIAAIACCFLSVIFIGYRSLGSSRTFHAANITVSGCKRLTKQQVLGLGKVDIYTNLLSISPDEIKKRIEAHAWVERADVLRELPETLAIDIKEREPAAIINSAKGLYYVDEKGVPFDRVRASGDHDFPVITGLEKKGALETIKESIFSEALLFIRIASRGDAILPKQNVSEIHITDNDEIIVFLVDRPFPIYLGRGKMKVKYKRLAKVLHRLYSNDFFVGTAYIRMDYADNKVLVGQSAASRKNG